MIKHVCLKILVTLGGAVNVARSGIKYTRGHMIEYLEVAMQRCYQDDDAFARRKERFSAR
ncbi:hypothetical protein CCR75_002518 [Bremia lactucae]|uniref:Uncharacterized protein n=1 Tax=Bremia lactucae TaxID=4779 RepID=A0A976NYL5_BRELC|nr:hypothetical protein CCR75_002518 [Bremia lactucae]